jgi:hypothetical protein
LPENTTTRQNLPLLESEANSHENQTILFFPHLPAEHQLQALEHGFGGIRLGNTPMRSSWLVKLNRLYEEVRISSLFSK